MSKAKTYPDGYKKADVALDKEENGVRTVFMKDETVWKTGDDGKSWGEFKPEPAASDEAAELAKLSGMPTGAAPDMNDAAHTAPPPPPPPRTNTASVAETMPVVDLVQAARDSGDNNELVGKLADALEAKQAQLMAIKDQMDHLTFKYESLERELKAMQAARGSHEGGGKPNRMGDARAAGGRMAGLHPANVADIPTLDEINSAGKGE